MKNYIKQMTKINILNSFDCEEINKYLEDGSFSISVYGRNNIIHLESEPCTKLEIILSGNVLIERIDESGHLMNIAEFFSGDLLGGNLMFSKKPNYPMTVTSGSSAVILEIGKDRLFKLFSDNNRFLKHYLEYTADNTVILSDRIRHYVNRTIRECLVTYLNYERIKQSSNVLKLNITKKALAERIGVQRTSLSRELSKMRNEGLINYDADTIELLWE